MNSLSSVESELTVPFAVPVFAAVAVVPVAPESVVETVEELSAAAVAVLSSDVVVVSFLQPVTRRVVNAKVVRIIQRVFI